MSLPVCRAAHRLAACVAFCGVFQDGERVATVFGLRSPGDLLTIDLQLPFTPGSHIDLEAVFPERGEELLDGRAFPNGHVLVGLPIDFRERHAKSPFS